MNNAPTSLHSATANPHRLTALIATLRQSRMFADLAPANLAAVAEGCSIKTLQKGEILFHEGEKADGFFVLQSGRISIFRLTPDGREQIICVFSPPESFAEVVLASAERYPANAMALEASQVIRVGKDHFRDLIRQNPELALHMLASMSIHLKHLMQSLHEIKGLQIESRLAAWLLEHSPADDGAGGPVSFVLPVSKKILAGQLGVTSETLSRTFARFRKDGSIRVEGTVLHLLDRQTLKSHADGLA
ncbi:Crp/Fnr family transcriptional regulator [Geminisphaera colitermitum]|uniref:Crp/Fnr family transcriptional regulator n=1 Tax=Geminisphaera colitermitum TaxID=1148786 RepID=UPI000158D572|nr:Crp/Fnr family transcriptional regulator [Geminisphaera colitermitum]